MHNLEDLPEVVWVPVPTKQLRDKIRRDASGCWMWDGQIADNGYGKFYVTMGAHRAAYTALVGAIPAGLQIDHLCRNRACVNPAHLEPVSPSENQRRAGGIIAKNMAKTACPRGHAYTTSNTRSKNKRRHCRTCARIRGLRYYHQGGGKEKRATRRAAR